MLVAALLPAPRALTQEGGQFCLRAFEDRDADGRLDAGEPLLTAGVSAELRDAAGLVVASGLLGSSPTAAQGVLCFQFLRPGEYTLLASHPAWRASSGFTRRIEAGGSPALVDFGAPRPALPARPATSLLPRVGLATLGALLVMGAMLLTGALLWFYALRRRVAGKALPRRP